jgi:DNA/RNA-binding domain of Phe-tRNA-synthetase-like protein
MPALTYTIAPEIFSLFPGYVRGVVLAFGVTNLPTPPELTTLLRQAEESVRARLAPETIANDPRIACWRDAYRAFGAKPSEFRSSHEAMARRALRGDQLPTINALVDIGNIVSLRHLLPAGGHAIDHLTGGMSLRRALGSEDFIPFGTDQLEHPQPGEIIFAQGDVVLTRRWTWRQGNHTLTVLDTQAIEFNVDGLPAVPRSEIEQACQEIIELTQQFCGGQARYEILTVEHPSLALEA